MKKILSLLILGISTLMIVVCSDANRSVVIKYNFDPAYQLFYKQDSKANEEVFSGDSCVKRNSFSIHFEVNQTVVRILDDKSAEIRELSAMSVIWPEKEDSTKKDTTVTRDYSIFTAPNGKILDVIVNSEVDSASLEYIKNWYQQASPSFPDSAVKKGSKWTNTSKLVFEGKEFEASTLFEVLGFNRERNYDCITLKYIGNVVLPILQRPDDTLKRSGMDEIKVEGTMNFAYKEGFIVNQLQTELQTGWRKGIKNGVSYEHHYSTKQDVNFYLAERRKL